MKELSVMPTFQTKEFYWNSSKSYALNYIEKTLFSLLKITDNPTDSIVLDAGCGGGYLLNQLYIKGYKNVYGFDISRSGIDIAKKTYPNLKNRFQVHDCYSEILPIDYPKNNYDIIISTEVIEHLYSPETYLKNIYYWLKPSKYLVLSTPYHGYLKNLLICIFNKFDSHFNPIEEGGHIKFFTFKNLNLLLKENGFQVIKFYGSGRIPLVWKSMVLLAKKI